MPGLRLRSFERRALLLARAWIVDPPSDFKPGQAPGFWQSTSLNMLSLQLSLLSRPDQSQTLQRLLQIAPFLLLVDWHSAERNLEWPFSAGLACLLGLRARFSCGNEGLDAFCAFQRSGGLAGLLHREKQHFHLCHYQAYCGGGLALALLQPRA